MREESLERLLPAYSCPLLGFSLLLSFKDGSLVTYMARFVEVHLGAFIYMIPPNSSLVMWWLSSLEYLWGLKSCVDTPLLIIGGRQNSPWGPGRKYVRPKLGGNGGKPFSEDWLPTLDVGGFPL